MAALKLQSDLRQTTAREELNHKIATIENDEIKALCTYTSDMPSMLKKLFFTLKGYDKVPPELTAEYMEIMRKAKSTKGITWSDDNAARSDSHFKFISTLDLDKPTLIPDIDATPAIKMEHVATELTTTDSEDLTDIENIDPQRHSAKKRKGTPIKLQNNETIVIDDSLEGVL